MKLKFLKSLWIFLLSPVLVFDNSSAVAQTSGCGSGSSWYLLRIGSPIAANQFRVACNEHDACYDTYGKSKQECDRAFHNRMLGICARDHNTLLGRYLKIACNGRADVYYTGVLEHAQDAYDKAQGAAKPSSSEAVSDINFCNKTSDKTIFGVYTSFDSPNGWTSHGWYKVEPGNCRKISIGRAYNGDIFIYGEYNSGSTVWGGQDASFCIDRTQSFHIPNSDLSCNGNQFKRVGMSKFSIRSGVNTWSYTP